MKYNFISLLIALLIYFFPVSVLAQQNDTLEIQRNKSGQIFFARFTPNADRKIKEAPIFLNEILEAKKGTEWKLVKENTDELGITHHRYQQYYNGIRVENAEYLVHGKGGIIDVINGDFRDISIASVIPKLIETEALGNALLFVHSKEYKWQDSTYQNFIKTVSNDPNATYYPKGELVIARDYVHAGKVYKLAWKFSISSAVPNNEQLIYVDADNGNIIGNLPQIIDANIPVNAQTCYSDNQTITGDTYTGGIRLNETRNGVNIHTWNAHNQANIALATEFNNSSANFTATGWPAFAQDQSALDAHWGAETVLDYWRIVHSRNSLNGTGLPVVSYVHFFDPHEIHPGQIMQDGTL